MKQTQNALKFLLAQYRAIFKHAYVKGLASAVLLTAGLAAGQAQAASADKLLTALKLLVIMMMALLLSTMTASSLAKPL